MKFKSYLFLSFCYWLAMFPLPFLIIALYSYKNSYHKNIMISGSFMTFLDLGKLLSIVHWCWAHWLSRLEFLEMFYLLFHLSFRGFTRLAALYDYHSQGFAALWEDPHIPVDLLIIFFWSFYSSCCILLTQWVVSWKLDKHCLCGLLAQCLFLSSCCQESYVGYLLSVCFA